MYTKHVIKTHYLVRNKLKLRLCYFLVGRCSPRAVLQGEGSVYEWDSLDILVPLGTGLGCTAILTNSSCHQGKTTPVDVDRNRMLICYFNQSFADKVTCISKDLFKIYIIYIIFLPVLFLKLE